MLCFEIILKKYKIMYIKTSRMKNVSSNNTVNLLVILLTVVVGCTL